jgi:hypothetical protein
LLTAFWESVGGKLAERSFAESLTPALLFFAGGLTAWAWSEGWDEGWQTLERWVSDKATWTQVVVVVSVVVGLIAATAVMNQLTRPLLRLLEGYLPLPLGWLARAGSFWRRQVRRVPLDVRYQELSTSGRAARTPREERELARIEAALHRMPDDSQRQMPTRLGDILRAAEDRPRQRYGLDPIICWPRLWLLLPDGARTDLGSARESLNQAGRAWLWGVLFISFSFWAWWAAPVGIAVAIVVYYGWMLSAADTYGALLEAAFDVHRTKLYEELRWPLPNKPACEPAQGEALTKYLWRGLAPRGFQFEGATETDRTRSGA